MTCDEAGGTVHYRCVQCGACCRWKGDVCLEEDEIPRIASFLGMDEAEFVNTYCRLRGNRQGLSLDDAEDGSCIMLDNGNVCRINPVKPKQCAGFPNTWNFPGWRDQCSAVPEPQS